MPNRESDYTKRFSVTVSKDDYERLQYWAKTREMSLNEYINDAIDRQIRYENKDYDIPTAEIARLNQLVDHIVSLSQNVSSLENIVISGFDSLLGLTRGDNYLRDYEGEE